MIPRERGEKIEWVRKYLLPIFDSQLNEVPEDNLDDANVERSEEILAEEYWDEGQGILTTFAKVSVPLVVIDALTSMPPQVYGLVFSITGTMIMLVQADILGSRSITVQSLGTDGSGRTGLDEGKARRLARNTVITNIGLVWLMLGFVMQLVAVWFVSSETLIQPII